MRRSPAVSSRAFVLHCNHTTSNTINTRRTIKKHCCSVCTFTHFEFPPRNKPSHGVLTCSRLVRFGPQRVSFRGPQSRGWTLGRSSPDDSLWRGGRRRTGRWGRRRRRMWGTGRRKRVRMRRSRRSKSGSGAGRRHWRRGRGVAGVCCCQATGGRGSRRRWRSG